MNLKEKYCFILTQKIVSAKLGRIKKRSYKFFVRQPILECFNFLNDKFRHFYYRSWFIFKNRFPPVRRCKKFIRNAKGFARLSSLGARPTGWNPGFTSFHPGYLYCIYYATIFNYPKFNKLLNKIAKSLCCYLNQVS
ncbi:Uncharacterised protein [Legionella busanensis]|uniref:Uncharacterized protein n=1 Tax=Legionella busanensis TaxID=190655 RepID=A0A378JLR3_9GAMM|nr:Uncharacterised protein [Legionella busanensis]